jgi:hypothetical protein
MTAAPLAAFTLGRSRTPALDTTARIFPAPNDATTERPDRSRTPRAADTGARSLNFPSLRSSTGDREPFSLSPKCRYKGAHITPAQNVVLLAAHRRTEQAYWRVTRSVGRELPRPRTYTRRIRRRPIGRCWSPPRRRCQGRRPARRSRRTSRETSTCTGRPVIVETWPHGRPVTQKCRSACTAFCAAR